MKKGYNIEEMKNLSSKNNEFKILDLFSGAGGFSYGLDYISNFKTVLANDFNESALSTLKHNMPWVETVYGDITENSIKKELITKSKELGVNMIIGGPPCQGFSLQGKKAGINDPRNFLFREYLKIVKEVNPEIFVIENVKSIVSSADGFFLKQIIKEFSELGYIVTFKIMKSIDHGIPQKRERAFIIGSIKNEISFKHEIINKKKVNIRDAISDLSYLNSGEGSNESDYINKAESPYQRKMRVGSKKLFNHISSNHSTIAIEKLMLIPEGGNKFSLPEKMRGKQKFNSTWSRLIWNDPSPTIDTRFDTPSNGQNSHPTLHRSITPREAARIQSFPDKFEFLGKKTEICKQIGNAVPPLLAKVIGEIILKNLDVDAVELEKGSLLINADAYTHIHNLIKSEIKVDHIITDPPYNISQKNNFNTLGNRKGLDFGNWDWEFDLTSWISNYNKILKKGGSIIIFCSFHYISHIVDKLKDEGFEIKDCIRWIKRNPMPRNRDRRYVSDYELAVWAVKPGSPWTFNRDDSKPYLRPLFETGIVSGKERTEHPTQKSLKLMEEIIKIHTNKGDLILDPFVGSGTTAVASKNLKRRYLAIEKEKIYYNLCKKRLK